MHIWKSATITIVLLTANITLEPKAIAADQCTVMKSELDSVGSAYEVLVHETDRVHAMPSKPKSDVALCRAAVATRSAILDLKLTPNCGPSEAAYKEVQQGIDSMMDFATTAAALYCAPGAGDSH